MNRNRNRGTYSVSNKIEFKPFFFRSNLCDYGDACIHVKELIETKK